MKTTKTPTSCLKSILNNREYILYNGDCLKLLKTLPDKIVDLTVTSPPYCMGKEYEKSLNYEDFVSIHSTVLPEIIRVTKDGGSICWQTGYHVINGVVTPLDYFVYDILSKFKDIHLRNRIVWTYGHGLHCKNRFSGRHEIILWFTKGKNYFFNLDEVRVPQKYPGKKYYKGEKKGAYSGNPLGKNPSDLWEIPNVKANHIEKTEHPCQFPIALVQRLVRSLTPHNGVVLDPFVGSGSSGVASILENREFIGAEMKEKYYKIADRRCAEAIAGNVQHRPLNKPIVIPDKRMSVAQKPSNFI